MNDLSRTKQARPEPGHPDQQGPVTAAQSKTRRCTPQGDAKLMAKEQVLRFKPARRLEEVDDEHCERMQEREHRPRSCDDSTRRCDSQAGRDFRKGQRPVHRYPVLPAKASLFGRPRELTVQQPDRRRSGGLAIPDRGLSQTGAKAPTRPFSSCFTAPTRTALISASMSSSALDS